jgi:hypothetical protein
VLAQKPTAGWKANAYVIFDYFTPTDFKFAGIDVSTDKIQMGHRTESGWVVDVQAANVRIKPDVYYNLLVTVNGLVVTVTINNSQAFSYAFQPQIIDGIPSNLNWGMVGFGSDNARGIMDNVQVKVLPRPFTLQTGDDFSDGEADLFTGGETGDWAVTAGRYDGTSAGGETAISLVDLGLERGLAANSRLELAATLTAQSSGGFIFDRYAENDYKFVTIDTANDRVVVGHHSRRGLTIDVVATRVFNPGVNYDVLVSLFASTVSITVDGQAVVGHVFNAVVVDGDFGVLSRGGTSSFDSVSIKTDDDAFRETGPESLMAATSATTPAPADGYITEQQLAPIVAEATARWSAALPGADVASVVGRLNFEVEDLRGRGLAQTVGYFVIVDLNAAGFGWFVDSTPAGDTEFAARNGPGELRAQASSPAVGRMDLLTVVMHEIGHALELSHSSLSAPPDVMTPTLTTGVRRLPVIGSSQRGNDADSTALIDDSTSTITSAPAVEPTALTVTATPTTTITPGKGRRSGP